MSNAYPHSFALFYDFDAPCPEHRELTPNQIEPFLYSRIRKYYLRRPLDSTGIIIRYQEQRAYLRYETIEYMIQCAADYQEMQERIQDPDYLPEDDEEEDDDEYEMEDASVLIDDEDFEILVQEAIAISALETNIDPAAAVHIPLPINYEVIHIDDDDQDEDAMDTDTGNRNPFGGFPREVIVIEEDEEADRVPMSPFVLELEEETSQPQHAVCPTCNHLCTTSGLIDINCGHQVCPHCVASVFQHWVCPHCQSQTIELVAKSAEVHQFLGNIPYAMPTALRAHLV